MKYTNDLRCLNAIYEELVAIRCVLSGNKGAKPEVISPSTEYGPIAGEVRPEPEAPFVPKPKYPPSLESLKEMVEGPAEEEKPLPKKKARKVRKKKEKK